MNCGKSWGVELWDRTDGVVRYCQDCLSQLDLFLKYLGEVQTYYIDAAKKNRKHASRYQPKGSKKEQEKNTFTYFIGFNELLNFSQNCEAVYSKLGEDIGNDVIKGLRDFYDANKRKLDRHQGECGKLQAQLVDKRREFDNAKSEYVAAHQRMVQADRAYQEAEDNKALSRLEVEKFKSIAEGKRDEYERMRGEFATALSRFNSYQNCYFTKTLPDWAMECEVFDMERLARSRAAMKKLAELVRRHLGDMAASTQHLDTSAEKIDAEEDSKTLIASLVTNHLPPTDERFIDLEKESPNSGSSETLPGKRSFIGKRKKANKETEEDKRISQEELATRIGHLQEALTQASTEHEAIKKMQKTYEENDKLGDPETCKFKIIATSRKIKSFSDQLEKLSSKFSGEIPGRRGDVTVSQITTQESDEEDFYDNCEGVPADAPKAGVLSEINPSNDQLYDEPTGIEGDTAVAPEYLGSCTAIFEYEGVPGDEYYLAMQENDQFYILGTDKGDGWLYVETLDRGNTGWIPSNYVETVYY